MEDHEHLTVLPADVKKYGEDEACDSDPDSSHHRCHTGDFGTVYGDFQKATGDPVGTLDLMVNYVESGTQFTVDYGDIDAGFYESLESMFSQTIKTLRQSDEETIDHFLPRLESVVYRAHNIGWGYYDTISDMLKKAFP